MDWRAESVFRMSSLLPTTKGDAKRSELWLSLISMFGALVVSHLSPDGTAASWVGIGVAVLLGGVYAFFRTPLAAQTSGVKTKAFWGSLITIVGSMAAVLADPTTGGVPEPVARVAGVVLAAVVATGYTVHRFRTKVKGK